MFSDIIILILDDLALRTTNLSTIFSQLYYEIIMQSPTFSSFYFIGSLNTMMSNLQYGIK